MSLKTVEVPPEVQNLYPPIPVNRSVNAVVSPEIFIVVDNIIYLHFSGNVARISEYFGIFVRSANNRYATSTDPRITLKIVGLLLLDVS